MSRCHFRAWRREPSRRLQSRDDDERSRGNAPCRVNRRARNARAAAGAGPSASPPPRPRPRTQPRLRFAPVDLVSRDELESIHQAALVRPEGNRHRHPARRSEGDSEGRRRRRRSDLGPRALRSRARRIARSASRPRRFTLHARNPERNVVIGDGHVAFCSVASTPNSFDREGGRRPGQSSRLSEFPAARPELRFDSRLGRLSRRARRHPRLGPPSRRAVRHADAVGQADPRLQPGARAHSRRHRDGAARARHRRRNVWSASRRCSRSSIPPRRCGSTRRCWKASSRWRDAIRSSC